MNVAWTSKVFLANNHALIYAHRMKLYPPLPADATMSQKYDDLMIVEDQAEANQLLERNVVHSMRYSEKQLTREEALRIERSNIAYMAGYHDQETRVRVERLFRCVHQLLGSSAKQLTVEEAFQLGARIGERIKNGESFDDLTHEQPNEPLVVRPRKRHRFIDQSYADRAAGRDGASRKS